MELTRDQIRAHLDAGEHLVGLIQHDSGELIFAPCISPRVYLYLSPTDGCAIQGYVIDQKPSGTGYFPRERSLNEGELKKINELLAIGYVPRVVEYLTKISYVISAHMMLLAQHLEPFSKILLLHNQKEDIDPDSILKDYFKIYGAFSISKTQEGDIEYDFTSGAFNSPPNTRVKGAQLDTPSQNIVREKVTALLSHKRSYDDYNNPNGRNRP